MDSVVNDVVELKEQHRKTWRNKPQWYWMLGLIEEVAELFMSLIGLHKDKPDWELMQISAICMNWLEMRDDRKGGSNEQT